MEFGVVCDSVDLLIYLLRLEKLSSQINIHIHIQI